MSEVKKHDYLVILDGETLLELWGVTPNKFQVELGKMVMDGTLPKSKLKSWFNSGKLVIEKDGAVSSLIGGH